MKIISLDKGCFAFILGLLLWCSHMNASYKEPCYDLAFWQSAVSGTVSDNTGPLSGVTVSVKGSPYSAVSDEKGHYAIAAAAGDTLIFSFIGYKDLEHQVTAEIINVTMSEDMQQLQEVVVNAGYYSVKDKERTGSISRITSREIEKQPVGNVLATMQGRMAGVSVVQETGVAGGGFTINIRGLNSLRSNGNNPLYIIDGVPYSSDPISNLQTSTSIPGDGNPLSSINPADIESMEILKDADATAIYGSRGANGVVLITTKKGKEGKTSFTLNTSHSTGEVTRFIDLMDTPQYLAMRRKAFANDGITEYPANAYDVNGTWDQNRYTDWQKELTGGTSQISVIQGTVSGGSEFTKFLISGNYRRETSVFPGDFSYKRGGARINVDHTSADRKFRATFSGSYTVQKNNLPWMDFVRLSRQLAPNAPALYDGQGNLNWENSTWENPLSNLESRSLSKTGDLIANAVLSYQLAEGLQVKSNFGFTDLKNDDSRSIPSTMYNPAYQLGSQYSSIYFNNLTRRSWIIEPQLNWSHAFGQSEVDILAGGTFQNQQSDNMVTLASGFASNSLLYDLASASTVLISDNDELVYKYQAFFGRVNYTYKGRYILNLTGRRDGSSRFGPGKRFAAFGAVGAAWLFSKEAFFERLGFLSF
ncbi:TonB-dependent receptor, partial [Nostoc linckia z16]